MNFSAPIQTTFTPEKIQKLLAERGRHVTLEQAKATLEFFIKLAQSTQHANSRSIHPGEHRRAS